MAKLNTLIKRATRPEHGPMGFGAAARKPQASMLLVAIIGDHWPRAVSDAAAAGADVLVLQGKPGDKDISEAIAAAGDQPCGVMLSDTSLDALPRLREAKVDFVLVGANSPAAALMEEELAVVLQLREELSDVQLRTLEAWPFGAIYFDRESAPATIFKLLDLQRVAGLARKPLMVQIPADTKQGELMALRDAGVALLAVDMKDRSAIDSLKRLRETVDALPRHKPRKEEKREAWLPSGGSGAMSEHGEEEEEDDRG